MSHSARKHLGLGTDDYDEAIRRFIPGYDEMVKVAADAVAAVRPELVRDLGAGTGALSEALLNRDEIGIVELIDIDPEMLALAKERLRRFGDRARFVLGSFDEPLPTSDAFAASLSLHHIPSIDAKASLYTRALAALRPGGVLVNGDVNMPVNQANRDVLYRKWADHLVDCGIPEAQAWKYFEEWSEEDTYLPRDLELEALAGVGFSAECVWTKEPVGVIVARKPNAG